MSGCAGTCRANAATSISAPSDATAATGAVSATASTSRTGVRSRMDARRRAYAARASTNRCFALRRAAGRRALLDAAADHVAQVRVVGVAVDGHRVLHGGLEDLVLGVGRDRDRAVHLARDLAAVDVLAGHGAPSVRGRCCG